MPPTIVGALPGVILPVEEAAEAPQALFAVTETVPAPLPIVTVTLVVPCPAVIDQPVPETDQVYEVALATAEILNVFPVVPEQLLVGWVIVPGVAGIADGAILPVVDTPEVPQALAAVTETVPATDPMVIVAKLVPCPPVTAQPVPVTDQL